MDGDTVSFGECKRVFINGELHESEIAKLQKSIPNEDLKAVKQANVLTMLIIKITFFILKNLSTYSYGFSVSPRF